MSLLSQTIILYLIVGIGVATAVYLSENLSGAGDGWFVIFSAVPFWPVYIPLLLAQQPPTGKKHSQSSIPPKDAMTAAIDQVDAELEAALGSLDGWAEDVLARERGRIKELRGAWTVQANRIREMDRLLTLPDTGAADLMEPDLAAATKQTEGTTTQERLRTSRHARRENIQRLHKIREQAHGDLMGTLAWVRELVSMIHLAKFTGAPASRAEELVGQIAAAVEGLAEITWQEDPTVHAAGST